MARKCEKLCLNSLCDMLSIWLPKQCFSLSNMLICIIGHFTSCKVVKIATFLSTTESIASDFSLVITNISKIELLDTNFGFRFLGFYLTKMLHFWNLSSGQEYISNEQFYKHGHILTLYLKWYASNYKHRPLAE